MAWPVKRAHRKEVYDEPCIRMDGRRDVVLTVTAVLVVVLLVVVINKVSSK